MSLDKKMNTIRGLLRKAESSTFAAEAETFMAKAQELMKEYAIEEELLWATEPKRRQTPIERTIKVATKNQTGNQARITLMHVIARNSRCRCYFMDLDAVVMGFETDVNFVEMLYLSLSSQMQMEMLREQAKTSINMRTYKANFIRAFANRIDDRMDAINHSYIPDSGKGEMVLRSREEDVDAYYREKISRMHMTKIPSSQSRFSREASNAGKIAADKADLSAGRRGPTKELNK